MGPDASKPGDRLAGVLVRAGGSIHYWIHGEPLASTVVCIHGVTLDNGAFDAQVPALVEAGYRVVTFDLTGHGLSRPATGRLSIERAAADVAALLDHLGENRVVLVGQSFGGFVAQEFYRRHPDRVAALVLAGAWVLGAQPPWHQRIGARLRPLLLRLWPAPHLVRTIPRFMSKRIEVQKYVARATRPLSKADLVAFTAAAVDGLTGSRSRLRIDVPVLFVYGGRERPWVVRITRAGVDQTSRTDVQSIPGAGHLVNQDEPARFNQIVLEFLRRHLPGPDTG
jgi:3-oxoadipate enol-lactonase